MMSDHQREQNEKSTAGFCSATCVNKECLQREIQKPEPKTSDFFATCNLPKRFEHPHWFNGYGSQVSKQHPFYRTSASEYGWYAPGIHSVPSVFYPAGQTFTNLLSAAGMYRNYSLNTGMDPPSYT
ncbi:piercer of microtubule wall 1 protein-like isoform X1 [Cydia pomonella]|uniref:piercer of microtubule wall 1 protein-like isoform X1 n=1 Tax=Cydia pomonella TaxID=82600 RepID=UPI002ADD69C3|nr:piercer of microtubule wall 1 protein-like isoform X1 [Cydia pomonella]XP_061728610.1 piercer of microtubule wall 1 protein-like isoform X1 [Cydia pomonella]